MSFSRPGILAIVAIAALAVSQVAAQAEEDSAAADERDVEEPERKSGYKNTKGFGSKASVNVQLDEDDQATKPAFRLQVLDDALKPWFDFKRRVHDEWGIEFGTDYTTTTMLINETLTDDDVASSGIARIYAKIDLLGRGTKNVGSLYVKGEHRHELGETTPAGVAGLAGYNGVAGTLFNDAEFVLSALNWQQYIDDGSTGIIAGRFDPNDYMDVSGYANPWTTFQNLAILFNGSIALPSESWGLGLGHWFNDSFYALASMSDANGTLEEVEPFEHGAEFFKQAGFGWTPSRAQRYTHNLQITVWHVDERDHLDIPDGEGITLNGNWTFEDRWMAFMRMGWSDSPSAIYEETYTVGGGYLLSGRTDVIALAINWGKAPQGGLDEQLTTEAFYRLQLAERLQVTLSGQWLHNPVFNPESDSVYIAGLRVRFTL